VDYAVLFWYCGTTKYRDIWVIIINSFVAQHNTTLYYFLFYVRCQDMCWHGYGVATVHCQCKVLFIYPLINLSSKNTTQNRYSINVTFLDYKYHWIKDLINRYKEVYLVGWWWNRIIWNVVRHLKSDRKIFVATEFITGCSIIKEMATWEMQHQLRTAQSRCDRKLNLYSKMWEERNL